MKKNLLRNIMYGLLVILLAAQFVRPSKNNSGDNTKSIETKFDIPADVKSSLEVACYDCHSNHTNYPWYAAIQPIAFWLQDHVNDGKKHLNFSVLGGRPAYMQNHKMEEIEEMISEDEMPLSSYTLIHRNAKLDANQKSAIIKWTKTVRDSLVARFPADSLKMPARKK
ncbi:MAG: heme-binding domain-containing protein [Saprospiraceae bacterium]